MAVINVFGLADVPWLAIKGGKQRVGKKKKRKKKWHGAGSQRGTNGGLCQHITPALETDLFSLKPQLCRPLLQKQLY